jgi:CBS domain-containing protein
MLVADVLRNKSRQVTTVQQSDSIGDVVRVLSEKRIGAVVVEDRAHKMIGVLSERDLVNALAKRGAEALHCKAYELMSSPVITCVATDRIEAALARMTKNRIRHLPVLEDEHLAGIVSIGDLVSHRLDEKALEADVLLDISRMRG